VTHALLLLLSFAGLLVGTLTMAQSCNAALDGVVRSEEEMVERTWQMARTRLSRLATEIEAQGINIRFTLKSRGQTLLTDFSRWDLVVQYWGQAQGGQDSYLIKRLVYTQGTPGNDEWRVEGIYLNAQAGTPEVFDPGILNPDEEMKVHMKLDPKVAPQSTNRALMVTSYGIAVPVHFTR
jgi:hypothetical protein